MSEARWYFGYRCEIDESIVVENIWVGAVYVPMWHPVRSLGFDDLFVLKISDEWIIVIDCVDTRLETLDAVQLVAARLRHMQNDWDRLSPYEREYRIW